MLVSANLLVRQLLMSISWWLGFVFGIMVTSRCVQPQLLTRSRHSGSQSEGIFGFSTIGETP
jgi:hypothetical protein